LSRKLKSTIKENLEADYIRFGKNWRPIKRKSDETMEHDKVYAISLQIILNDSGNNHHNSGEEKTEEEAKVASKLRSRNAA
jgi:hypothetical protein